MLKLSQVELPCSHEAVALGQRLRAATLNLTYI